MFSRILPLLAGLLALPVAAADAPGNVIFIHADGTPTSGWMATRWIVAGPDGRLNWDQMPHVAVYDGRMSDDLTATSHGGATAHAWGVRSSRNSYGLMGSDARSLSGFNGSILQEAIAAGRPAGIVNSGSAVEPGTAVFATSAASRSDNEGICAGLVASGVPLILGGGEEWFLPAGTDGRHGPGKRTDGRDLVKEARDRGYVVVFTREELAALPADTPRVLGLFARAHTFNDRTEEALRDTGLPMFDPAAPTLAEMTAKAIEILSAQGEGFFLVVEEEGSDNFGNNNNAAGVIESLRRADEAIGIALGFAERNPRTLVITTSDSGAGGFSATGLRLGRSADEPLPARDRNGAPIDGRDGAETPPFESAPDRVGRRFLFQVSWALIDDTSGGVVARAAGHRAERISGNVTNIDIYRAMHSALFGGELAAK
ncbi:MAG TPA: alkaline phosphatase [Opitutaceae bacterium]|nr:alkaline phosphatase [Opitutaceae bacterium]